MTTRWSHAVRSSGLWRFVRAGAGDAVRGLARITDRVGPDEVGVADTVESSAAVAALARGLAHLRAAADTSAAAAAAGAQWTAWRDQSPADRTRNTGIALLTAAAVHVVLSFWRRPVAGWLWLVAPVLAGAFGLLMAIAPHRANPGEPRT